MSFADLYRRGTERTDFEHTTVHEQLVSGPGTAANAALPPVAEGIASGLERIDRHLCRGLRESQGRWQDRGAELAAGTTPLSRAIRALRSVSEELDRRVARQAERFSDVQAMPPPGAVTPIELGGGPGTPWRFLDPQSDKELQERAATAAEEAARHRYERYRAETGLDDGVHTPRASVPSPRAR